MRKHNLAFIDIETTGLDITKHEIIEIGCVIVSPGLEVIEEFELKIKPKHIEDANKVSLKISHYSEEKWVDAVSLKKALEFLAVKTEGCIMVGQNVAFDSGFLEYAFSKTKIKNTMHYHRLDTISIAWAKFHKDVSFDHFSLREMCLRFGIVNAHAHTALSDARATFALYKKLMNL
ncbi:MAG: 3'-5' exonuclease [Candidatus Pacebacteria bacterium]|nr:3'-5' exonuclease [Candidatus Paceibacterota bacterium]